MGDGPETSTLKTLVNTNGIEGVIFIPFLDQDRLCEVYHRASALVLPSFYGETWGLVVNEAMNFGLPVLVSNECGCANALVKSGENGWLFNPNDVDEMCGVLNRCSSISDDEARAMADKSRHIIDSFPLTLFVTSIAGAVHCYSKESSGYARFTDRMIIGAWRGRFRTT